MTLTESTSTSSSKRGKSSKEKGYNGRVYSLPVYYAILPLLKAGNYDPRIVEIVARMRGLPAPAPSLDLDLDDLGIEIEDYEATSRVLTHACKYLYNHNGIHWAVVNEKYYRKRAEDPTWTPDYEEAKLCLPAMGTPKIGVHFAKAGTYDPLISVYLERNLGRMASGVMNAWDKLGNAQEQKLIPKEKNAEIRDAIETRTGVVLRLRNGS